MWLNGKAVAQNKAVWTKDDFTRFGIEETGYPLFIGTTIAHIRSSTSVV